MHTVPRVARTSLYQRIGMQRAGVRTASPAVYTYASNSARWLDNNVAAYDGARHIPLSACQLYARSPSRMAGCLGVARRVRATHI